MVQQVASTVVQHQSDDRELFEIHKRNCKSPPEHEAAWLQEGWMGLMGFVVFAAFVLFVVTKVQLEFLFPVEMDSATKTTIHAVCMGVFVWAIPFTNVVAFFTIPKTKSDSQAIIRTIRRGWWTCEASRHFFLYQLVGWVLYAIVLLTLVFCAAKEIDVVGLCEFGFETNVAVLAFISEALMISSYLALSLHGSTPSNSVFPHRNRFAVMLNNFINMLLIIGAFGLAISSETVRFEDQLNQEGIDFEVSHHELRIFSSSSALGSIALCVTALFSTYGLGGFLSSKAGWKFYQPFAGGVQYVLLQGISWTCLAFGIFLQLLYLLSLVLLEMELFVGIMVAGAVLLLISEVVMVISLLVFKSSAANRAEFKTHSVFGRIHCFMEGIVQFLMVAAVVNLQWIPSIIYLFLFKATTDLGHVEICLYSLFATGIQILMVMARSIASLWHFKDSERSKRPISVYRPKYVLPQVMAGSLPAVFVYLHYVYKRNAFLPVSIMAGYFYGYIGSYRGDPEFTGRRFKGVEWTHQQGFFIESVARYFSARIVAMTPLDPQENFIWAVHPHGIMSVTASWVQFSKQFQQLFPNRFAHVLSASVLHHIPLTRDVLQWFGSREVSHRSFVGLLEEKKDVLLVPGGQAEMIESVSGRKQMRLFTGHRGFVRLAMHHGVSIVPIIGYQEGEYMDIVKAPTIQRWCTRHILFPLPWVPYGRWFLPVPRKIESTIVVGSPFVIEKCEAPTKEQVEEAAKRYYAHVKMVYDKHKEEAGCADYELVLL